MRMVVRLAGHSSGFGPRLTQHSVGGGGEPQQAQSSVPGLAVARIDGSLNALPDVATAFAISGIGPADRSLGVCELDALAVPLDRRPGMGFQRRDRNVLLGTGQRQARSRGDFSL